MTKNLGSLTQISAMYFLPHVYTHYHELRDYMSFYRKSYSPKSSKSSLGCISRLSYELWQLLSVWMVDIVAECLPCPRFAPLWKYVYILLTLLSTRSSCQALRWTIERRELHCQKMNLQFLNMQWTTLQRCIHKDVIKILSWLISTTLYNEGE